MILVTGALWGTELDFRRGPALLRASLYSLKCKHSCLKATVSAGSTSQAKLLPKQLGNKGNENGPSPGVWSVHYAGQVF